MLELASLLVEWFDEIRILTGNVQNSSKQKWHTKLRTFFTEDKVRSRTLLEIRG